MAKRKDITGRDAFIMAEALTFTIEAFSCLPIEHRPNNNITDMKRILGAPVKQDGNIARSQLSAHRRLESLLKHGQRPIDP